MPVSRIVKYESLALQLEVPIKDFRTFPELIGCTIQDRGEDSAFIVTHPDAPGCHLMFHPFGDHYAFLGSVEIKDDTQGRFFQQVLGVLMIQYCGNLSCEIEWNQPKGERVRVDVIAGESTYPLLASLVAAEKKKIHPVDSPKVEALLTEAKSAWAEYQRLKASRDKTQES
jgi:hypothetical protein